MVDELAGLCIVHALLYSGDLPFVQFDVLADRLRGERSAAPIGCFGQFVEAFPDVRIKPATRLTTVTARC